MKVKSAMIQQASGSLGGATWAHNAGGMYIRSRTTPTDPGSTYQTNIRQIVAGLVNHWVNTLTQVQRDLWNVYAENVPLDDVFGDPRFRSGINHYVRSNTPRIQRLGTRIDDGPTIFNLGDYTLPTFSASEATQAISVGFNQTDEWATEDNAYLMIWASRPQNPTINFFKGPYRSAAHIIGDSGGAPATPAVIAAPFAFSEGQKVFCRANVSRADGRLGTVVRTFCTAAA